MSYCRVCKCTNLKKVLTLGPTPLANAFLTKTQIDEPEYFYPLDVYFCNDCGFVQLGHVVSRELLFKNYVYISSTSSVFVNHFKKLAQHVILRFSLIETSLLIDIGSNDGILLKPFKDHGIKVLGIEPAIHIANIAKKKGINTIPEFFSVDLARKIVKDYGYAKVVTATNVFAHIDQLDDVIKGLRILLSNEGVFIIEVPYLIDFLKKTYFDLVYHEHLSYWCVNSLISLFRRFDMEIFDVQKMPVHGGTIRIFAKKSRDHYKKENRVNEFLDLERKMKLTNNKTYINFANVVQKAKIKLLMCLADLKSKGNSIAGYGAPAKGNTLLNYFGIGTETLDFIIDDSPFKQGLFTPGKHVPVVASKELYIRNPKFVLILAWNFADSIMAMHKKYKDQGGKFIIPLPIPKII